MRFIDRLKYTNKYSRLNSYFLKMLLLLNKQKLKTGSMTEICSKYLKIVGLGSGPSLNLCELDERNLYLTTNSSYLYLNYKMNFIHFIKDLNYLKKFLLFGLKYKPKLVVIEIYTHSIGCGLGKLSIEVVEKYFGKRKFDFPVIVTNNENLFSLNSKNYYNNRIDFIKENQLNNPDTNSGLMIYGYSVWLTSKIESIKECDIYGLDAGEGGKKYFNGVNTLPNHVAMRDENKKHMGSFINECQNIFSFINNYSYFQNNKNNI